MDHFVVEDLLDFSKDVESVVVGTKADVANSGSLDSSTVTAVDSTSSNNSVCEPNNCFSAGVGADFGSNFSGELCVPYDDLAELEWLSNFVEESFSTEDLQRLQLISGIKARPDEGSETTHGVMHEADPNPQHPPSSPPMFHPDMPVPAKARSKRSRAAPSNWASRLLVLSDPPVEAGTAVSKKVVRVGPKKRQPVGPDGNNGPTEARKCLHCATDKTPQWRTGPMGPKTLCNACGVRYKSGRLVPEYRPAASPTFVLTKHSNSHRKVLELRRQKEMHMAQQIQQQQFFQSQSMIFDVPNADDYLIHQHVGPNFRQLI